MTPSAVTRPAALTRDEVLLAYDRVSGLYPFVPPLSLWRAWECAAYARFTLTEPVLDVGCGDGAFFRFLWPQVRRVVGVDRDPEVARHAEGSGVYERVLQSPASLIDEDGTYGSAFANCSLEHMDELAEVLSRVHRALRPGGHLLCSVVTDRFVAWLTLPAVLRAGGLADTGARWADDYLQRHHLANPLTAAGWQDAFRRAGFTVREHIPIVPEASARVFLTLDHLWHIPGALGAAAPGEQITRFLEARPGFPRGFRQVLAGLLEMELDPEPACGAVFLVERAEG
jgi:SAM-dependent methyltransferase